MYLWEINQNYKQITINEIGDIGGRNLYMENKGIIGIYKIN
ncbi:hypothetical protein CLL_A2167 [Clostridium botulinum B str. Eklund 17B (NRP)]|uniref:Uncharacterized protein n=1 Tax=Clostridium botulinum (strain Eklund 17B / Type B) TaxID=935198 RepID=B2TPT2_CLOBB|nr:hypothetical protein CLL_A2167 [Clostridium botulinum B str. Eklund 17B (NRP)]CDH91072.1 hypothetical protein CB17B2083 [Clostridium botulinum B str. Eklund 17B (NRP)]